MFRRKELLPASEWPNCVQVAAEVTERSECVHYAVSFQLLLSFWAMKTEKVMYRALNSLHDWFSGLGHSRTGKLYRDNNDSLQLYQAKCSVTTCTGFLRRWETIKLLSEVKLVRFSRTWSNDLSAEKPSCPVTERHHESGSRVGFHVPSVLPSCKYRGSRVSDETCSHYSISSAVSRSPQSSTPIVNVPT
jgi:hypothetical protein